MTGVGLVGVGNWGANWLRTLATLPEADLRWACDLNQGLLGKDRRRLPGRPHHPARSTTCSAIPETLRDRHRLDGPDPLRPGEAGSGGRQGRDGRKADGPDHGRRRRAGPRGRRRRPHPHGRPPDGVPPGIRTLREPDRRAGSWARSGGSSRGGRTTASCGPTRTPGGRWPRTTSRWPSASWATGRRQSCVRGRTLSRSTSPTWWAGRCGSPAAGSPGSTSAGTTRPRCAELKLYGTKKWAVFNDMLPWGRKVVVYDRGFDLDPAGKITTRRGGEVASAAGADGAAGRRGPALRRLRRGRGPGRSPTAGRGPGSWRSWRRGRRRWTPAARCR